MQQVLSQEFYVPSDILDEVQSEFEYQQEVRNMLATIMETKRQMDATVQKAMIETTPAEQRLFIEYQGRYPKLVDKVQLKFEKFNLNLSQILRFIQIQEKFMRIKKQQNERKRANQINNETNENVRKPQRKNLVEIHRMQMKKKPYQINPRVFH